MTPTETTTETRAYLATRLSEGSGGHGMNPKESAIIERLKGDGCSLRFIRDTLGMTLVEQAREFCKKHRAKPVKGGTKWRVPNVAHIIAANRRLAAVTETYAGAMDEKEFISHGRIGRGVCE